MNKPKKFRPWPPLIAGYAQAHCRAIVIIPVRNEESSLPSTLDALACQVDLEGHEADPCTFEILILLNNCEDSSARVAEEWVSRHPNINLHVAERMLRGRRAHVGTARRWLMDTAWRRLQARPQPEGGSVCVILSTDSDTWVSPTWIARNLSAVVAGADAVGGVIHLKDGELDCLPPQARRSYLLDRTYQHLVAELEDMLDPQPGDPWPRHLEHFGASLACTVRAYANVGGMAAVNTLEDVAFVDALRRQGARLRHDPSVIVYTSARFDGRAEVGLSFQLREWQRLGDQGQDHVVPSCRWLVHRFRMLAQLRAIYDSGLSAGIGLPRLIHQRVSTARRNSPSVESFLLEIDCDQIIETTFRGERLGPIQRVNRNLREAILNRSR